MLDTRPEQREDTMAVTPLIHGRDVLQNGGPVGMARPLSLGSAAMISPS